MSQEIERKFRIKKLPESLEQYEKKEIDKTPWHLPLLNDSL